MRSTRRVCVATVVALTVISLSGCASDERPPRATAPDPGVAHVHGLGVDPADGTLYAATHYGLFRIPPTGAAVRVANRYQDTMGFTVAGPNLFLGSGHPDPKEHLPGRLGLIESTDRGETWKALSLSGEADFHAPHAVGDQVYGWDAATGRFMTSSDRRTWQTRSTLGLLDFAVNPTNPQDILATTQQGLARSGDGGRTFATAGPALTYLSWPAQGELWGVAPDGAVSRSRDAGRTWEVRGRLPGATEALAVVGGTIYAAVSGDGIYTSTDGGATLTVRYPYQH